MTTLAEAKHKVRELSQKALLAVDDPKMTSAQKKSVLDDVEPQIKHWTSEVQTLESFEQRKKSIGWLSDAGNVGGSGYDARSGAAGSGSMLVRAIAAKGYKQIAPPQLVLSGDEAQQLHEAGVARKSFAIEVKDVSTTATGSASIGESTIPDIRPQPFLIKREPTRILSLLPAFGSTAGQVEWFLQTTNTSNAGPVPEMGLKPSSSVAYSPQFSKPTKLAHIAEVSDESLSDWSGFLSVLESDMVNGLIQAENAELLLAVANAANAAGDPAASKWNGLLNTTGILTYDRSTNPGDNDIDAFSRAFDALRIGASYTEPDGLILHPTTWGTMRRSKNTQGQYYLGAPDETPGDPRLWGVPVVLTTKIPVGTALVGAFQESVAVYMREAIRVDVNGFAGAQWMHNTTLVRAEERLTLTVPRPAGLLKLTGL